jgi:hypothetical protein
MMKRKRKGIKEGCCGELSMKVGVFWTLDFHFCLVMGLAFVVDL